LTPDVIIVEDDPYFFLQQDAYVPRSARKGATSASLFKDDDEQAFIDSLAPSFVKFDYEGRVVRCDSFSKTIAPGSRLGWFTCNEVFAERFERQSETSTQAPCGFGQVCILLKRLIVLISHV
jgi:aromatic amino acid aminotransferase I / 2-aminoadipate transaminase